jgi:hypothetical protein
MEGIISNAATEIKPQIEENRGISGKFTRVPNQMFDRGRYLTVKAKWVFATLCSFRNSKTGATFPSYPKIIERSGINRNDDISKALDELEEFGWLKRTHRFNESNWYDLSMPVVMRPTKEEAKYWKQVHSRKRSADVDAEIEKWSLQAEGYETDESYDETSESKYILVECNCNLETCKDCQIPF